MKTAHFPRICLARRAALAIRGVLIESSAVMLATLMVVRGLPE